jgi:TRAP-type C4-dicarboxylate transport system permease small subunit
MARGAIGTAEPPVGETIVERACRVACEMALVAMVAITCAEVALRAVTGGSLGFADEVGGYLLAAVTFLAVPVAVVWNAIHRVEYVQNLLGRRGRAMSEAAFLALALAFALTLDWQLARLVLRSFEADVLAPTMLGTPLWIPQSAMLAGGAVLAFSLLRLLLRRLSPASARRGRDR